MEKLNMPVANLATGIYTEDSLELILDQYVILSEEIGFNIDLDRSLPIYTENLYDTHDCVAVGSDIYIPIGAPCK